MLNTEDKAIETIIANIHIVRDQARELELQVEQLENRLNLARGTGDVTAKAQQALQMVADEEREPKKRATPEAVKERVESILREHSLNAAHIAKEAAHSLNKITEVLKELRKEKKIANVGTADFPVWTLRIGDHTSTKELIKMVRRLITERPLSTPELAVVTGARMSRVSGALVHLQRTEDNLLNLGTPRRARWLLVGDNVVRAKISSKEEPVKEDDSEDVEVDF